MLEAMAAAAQGAIGGEPDLLAVLPHEVGGQEPVESVEAVTDTGGKRLVDDFFQNVETDLRDDQVDTPGGIQGNT